MIVMKDNWRNTVFAALTSGALYALSLDIGPFGPLALIAPVPLLLVALTSKRVLRVASAAFITRVVSFAGIFIAYGGTLPLPALLGMAAVFAVAFTVIVLATSWSARCLPGWIAVFTFPMFATAIEFLLLSQSPHGTFAAMGYSLMTLLPLAQFASIAGVAGLTFVVALVPMSIAMLLVHSRAWREITLAGVLPISLILVFGFYRLTQPYDSFVRVGLGAIDELTMRALNNPADATHVAERYVSLARSGGQADADFIVFPERVFVDTQGETGSNSELMQRLSKVSGATVVAGFDEKLVDERHANTARIFLPQGESLRYVKRRLVPGLELNLTPGSEATVMGSTGVAICKDMDFAPMIREYGRQGVTLMLVPAWDFGMDGRLHSRMAMLRSIENGFAMVRAAANGRLTVNDTYGRVLAERETARTEPVWLAANVGLSVNSQTIYAKIGDAFAWATVMCSICLLVISRQLVQRRLAPAPASATSA